MLRKQSFKLFVVDAENVYIPPIVVEGVSKVVVTDDIFISGLQNPDCRSELRLES